MLARAALAAVAAAFYLAVAGDSLAQEPASDFTGLWQGVDNVDGSLRTLSIADLDGDGVWEVLGHDTYWTLCKGPDALEVTTGTVQDGVLRTTGTIRCRDGQEVAVETTFAPQGPIEGGMMVEHVVGKDFRTLLFRIDK